LRSPGFRLPALRSGLVAAPAYGLVVFGALTRSGLATLALRAHCVRLSALRASDEPRLYWF